MQSNFQILQLLLDNPQTAPKMTVRIAQDIAMTTPARDGSMARLSKRTATTAAAFVARDNVIKVLSSKDVSNIIFGCESEHTDACLTQHS